MYSELLVYILFFISAICAGCLVTMIIVLAKIVSVFDKTYELLRFIEKANRHTLNLIDRNIIKNR